MTNYIHKNRESRNLKGKTHQKSILIEWMEVKQSDI